MLQHPNGNARLRPGDRLWVDLTLSSEESDDGNDDADNLNRRQLVAQVANINPPRVDIRPAR